MLVLTRQRDQAMVWSAADGPSRSPGRTVFPRGEEEEMKRLFGRPSPAMLIALLALLAALGGTAVGASVLGKKKVKNITNNQITKRGPRPVGGQRQDGGQRPARSVRTGERRRRDQPGGLEERRLRNGGSYELLLLHGSLVRTKRPSGEPGLLRVLAGQYQARTRRGQRLLPAGDRGLRSNLQ